VFFKEGLHVQQGGYPVLGPGRHTLQTQNIPFLNNFINKYTGGNVFIAQVFFVKTTPQRRIPFGGSCGEVVDPETGLQVPMRIFGEMAVAVTDPLRFIINYAGFSSSGDNEETLRWVTDKFINSVGTTLTDIATKEHESLLNVINNREKLAQAFVARAPGLEDLGVKILDISKIEPNVPEEFMSEIRAKKKELADARWDVKKKQIAIEGAKADMQAKQFELDQKFQQDSRYVKELAGSYQGYAAGQAMIGAGQGMAAHGMGDGLAGAGAQMALGVNMAQGMAAGMAPQAPPAQAQAPQVSTGGVLVTCSACSTQQPGGKFCQECGTPLAQPKKFCHNCGTELAGAAKFCSGCGTKAG
jgi:membrane protease subunit (stomatin/prohibitin family)